MSTKVPIVKLSSGVPGLDEVLGDGIPEFSLNLIVGGAGSGKTTLGHQIMFANASQDRKALFLSIIGEPPLKMLRYMQQYSFFDTSKVGDSGGAGRRARSGARAHHPRDRGVEPGDRHRRLLSRCTSQVARRSNRGDGGTGIRSAAREPPHELRGDLVFARRVPRRGAGRLGLHRG